MNIKKATTDPVNVLIIGTGHYSTGMTALTGRKTTDKDFGVLLPSILELRRQGLVGEVFLAGKNGKKISALKKRIHAMAKQFGWDDTIRYFPSSEISDAQAYKQAFSELPKPGVILIATPDATHKQIILDSIKVGLHFMVVKPLVVRVRDLKEIIRAIRGKQLLGMVDYHKVYDEANLILKQEYESGRYGDLQHVFSKMSQRRDMLTIFKQWAGKEGHNINHYLGSHYIHMVGYITGAVPCSVRATCQYGIAKKEYCLDTPDLIETQVLWRAKNGTSFASYHIAGWADPSETSGMTYQELHLIGTKGHIDSDQRFRGFETVLEGEGQRVSNPYFFHLHPDPSGRISLESKYGFKSVRTFIEAAQAVENGTDPAEFDSKLPTVRESYYVTAILDAADESLKNGSKVINLNLKDRL